MIVIFCSQKFCSELGFLKRISENFWFLEVQVKFLNFHVVSDTHKSKLLHLRFQEFSVIFHRWHMVMVLYFRCFKWMIFFWAHIFRFSLLLFSQMVHKIGLFCYRTSFRDILSFFFVKIVQIEFARIIRPRSVVVDAPFERCFWKGFSLIRKWSRLLSSQIWEDSV